MHMYVYRYINYCLDLSDVLSITATPRCGGDNHNRHLSASLIVNLIALVIVIVFFVVIVILVVVIVIIIIPAR